MMSWGLTGAVLGAPRQRPAAESLPARAFATVREASRRVCKMRHYDVQLIGGMLLNRGAIAEMKTGEGKTLVATCPLYFNALQRKGAPGHGQRLPGPATRSGWGASTKFLGMTVGTIVHGQSDIEKQHAYRCDITYGTNNGLASTTCATT